MSNILARYEEAEEMIHGLEEHITYIEKCSTPDTRTIRIFSQRLRYWRERKCKLWAQMPTWAHEVNDILGEEMSHEN